MPLSKEQRHEERRKTLLVWLLNNGSNYGYDIHKGCKMRLWHMYPLLTELEAGDLVTRTEDMSVKRPPRIIYGLTERGRAEALRLRRQS
ncbi:MAG TPA: helix-turn-helix transcriptional regulator [Candidatus Saccharibacteria bacterium]|nr:helix-turn-helix transcriptional regulator [Candidatus Saccharibacteria bacterium]